MDTEPDSPRITQALNKKFKTQLSQPEEQKKPPKVRLHQRFSVFLFRFGCGRSARGLDVIRRAALGSMVLIAHSAGRSGVARPLPFPHALWAKEPIRSIAAE